MAYFRVAVTSASSSSRTPRSRARRRAGRRPSWRCGAACAAPPGPTRARTRPAPRARRGHASTGAGIGAADDMSSMSAYFATVLRLTPSLLAISARGTPPASIDRISFIMSRGTVISSILPGRARQSLRPGTRCGESRAPDPSGRGSRALSAQFLMITALKKQRLFGPLLSEHQH